jgi:bifunctional UDP-N-acetylglucosamine pyrophosphorylase/glucosamine-1-phosphate N-acetyltransferase
MIETPEVSIINLRKYLAQKSSTLDFSKESVAIILAAGHGKRIKSATSKMLHEIWGVPTVERVASAARDGLGASNLIIVVGIKAKEVADALGKRAHQVFVYQEHQRGTGDAVREALTIIPKKFKGDVYIFPGDLGLLNAEELRKFKDGFLSNSCDMMVLSGLFVGDIRNNYYGRIVRVPEQDAAGKDSGKELGKVIEIKEHKDILALPEGRPYQVAYKGRTYAFSKPDLLALPEFNTGVYAFKSRKIQEYIDKLKTDNVQGELYLTDLISIFNENKLTVKSSAAHDNHAVLGFNVKSVLKEMEIFARQRVFEQLKDIVTIEDQHDFFIAEEVVKRIVELDKKSGPLDIYMGKGVFISRDVELNKGVQIRTGARLSGRIILGENVRIEENVYLSTYANQTLKIGRGTQISKEDIIKGNLEIGENCYIGSSVNMTGSDEYPTRIGHNAFIKGTSYIFGCIIEDDIYIEHSVLKFQHIHRMVRRDGTVQPIRYVLPLPEGLDSISEIRTNLLSNLASETDSTNSHSNNRKK